MKGRNPSPCSQSLIFLEVTNSTSYSGLSQVCTDVSEIRGWSRWHRAGRVVLKLSLTPWASGSLLVLSNFHLSSASSAKIETAVDWQRGALGWKGFHEGRWFFVVSSLKRQCSSRVFKLGLCRLLQMERCEELQMEGAFNLWASYKSKVNLINLDTLCVKNEKHFT